MRLFTPASLCLAAAAALLPAATPVHAAPHPACATSDDHTFPLTTRIRGGPDSYTAGGGYGTWYLDLTNTTARPCTGIHPVVVLVDDKRALKPSQPRLEFYDGTRPRPVRFEPTDADELVGVFADDFPGYTVGPGRTLTVKMRLAVTSDAVPNDVTVNAAVVQRHDDDGDWVGQSNDYRFGIETEPDDPAPTAGTDSGRLPDPEASAVLPDSRLPLAEELARTGAGGLGLMAAAALLLVGAGTGALMWARRRR